MSVFVHTLADSTMDNPFWFLNGQGSNAEEAIEDSVEGQLNQMLNPEGGSKFQVVSHAYDGFTTSSVLNGGAIGKVLPGYSSLTTKIRAYLQIKKVNLTQSNFVHPLNDLKRSIELYRNSTHYVVISIGGNDFRERLHNPIGLLKEIPRVHERYLRILEEVKGIKDRDIRPILMFQYRLDANNDCYYIYRILKGIGIVAAAVQSLCLAGIAASAISVRAGKINMRLGLIFGLISATFLALSTRIMPLKVTKGILSGQEIGMTVLGALMEMFYRPILAQAKKDKLPILDLPNTFHPYDNLYVCQIEPGKEGGTLIAEGISHIVKRHRFYTSSSMIYSKRISTEYTAIENRDPAKWQVHYPSKRV